MSVVDRIAAIQRAALLKKLGGRRVVLSISGGKDSTAASLLLRELGIEHDRVHCVTGWDHPATMAHLEELSRALGPITMLRPKLGMADLIRAKAMFPSRQRRFCTQQLKIYPIAEHLQSLDVDCVNAVGVRADESKARSKLPEWEWFDVADCEMWRPLLAWSVEDVIEMHQRHNVPPCALYLRLNVSRVGCWPCLFARKAEIRLVADTDPGRIDEIRALEHEVGVQAEARYLRDRAIWLVTPDAEPSTGEAEKHLRWTRKRDRLTRPFQSPTFFQPDEKDELGRYRMPTIDEVVEWSRTSYGGKQREMFAPGSADAGCVRWGMCDLVVDLPDAPSADGHDEILKAAGEGGANG